MNIEIYQDTSRAAMTDRAVPSWSFRIDGIESGFWSPTRYAVERCISRLKEGRSREAFGDKVDVFSNGVKVAEARTGPGQGRAKVTQFQPNVQQSTRKMKSGREKPPVNRPMFRAELDGEHIGDYATEKEARAACAFKAFMTRGKAKLHDQQVETAQGKRLTVKYTGKGLRAVDNDGNEYAVGFRSDGRHVIKPILPPESEGQTK